MEKKRTYYGYTTFAQRKLLFETWEATGNIEEACQKARVAKRTFYYWQKRFKESGYPGLEKFKSRAPKNPKRIGGEIERQVVEMHQAHPEWGKQRIAQELAKANNWVPIVSLNTVRRILRKAGMWQEKKEKKRYQAE
jgi:transposase